MNRRLIYVVLAHINDCDCIPHDANMRHLHVVAVVSTEKKAEAKAKEFSGWWEAMELNQGEPINRNKSIAQIKTRAKAKRIMWEKARNLGKDKLRDLD